MCLGFSALIAAAAAAAATAATKTWTPRRPPVWPRAAHQLKSPTRWPAEPPPPAGIDAERFRAAFIYLCSPRSPDAGLGPVADDLVAAASEAGVDPFLLAALVFEQSRCKPDYRSPPKRGILGIAPEMYQSPDAPPPPVERGDWAASVLSDPKRSLGIGARLLRMWEDQHPDLDRRFGGIPHRTGVAHFLWGDVVRNSGGEDMVLTARRRLIGRYTAFVDAARPTSLGLLVPPLEGAPRVASSGPGEDRSGGARRHRGLDIAAVIGEPVRSIADGVVIFAGVNLPGHARKGPVPPDQVRRYANRVLGPGGIYLCIEHPTQSTKHEEIVSCYMHLAMYTVAADQRVTAGQLIGYVGRTGVTFSAPHLHIELRVDDKYANPMRYFADVVIPPRATKTYPKAVAKRQKRLKERAAVQESPAAQN